MKSPFQRFWFWKLLPCTAVCIKVKKSEMKLLAKVGTGCQQWSQSWDPGSGIWVEALRPEHHKRRPLVIGIWKGCVWRASATAALVWRQFWTSPRVQACLLPLEAVCPKWSRVFKGCPYSTWGQDRTWSADIPAELTGPPCPPEIQKPLSPSNPLWVRIQETFKGLEHLGEHGAKSIPILKCCFCVSESDGLIGYPTPSHALTWLNHRDVPHSVVFTTDVLRSPAVNIDVSG